MPASSETGHDFHTSSQQLPEEPMSHMTNPCLGQVPNLIMWSEEAILLFRVTACSETCKFPRAQGNARRVKMLPKSVYVIMHLPEGSDDVSPWLVCIC